MMQIQRDTRLFRFPKRVRNDSLTLAPGCNMISSDVCEWRRSVRIFRVPCRRKQRKLSPGFDFPNPSQRLQFYFLSCQIAVPPHQVCLSHAKQASVIIAAAGERESETERIAPATRSVAPLSMLGCVSILPMTKKHGNPCRHSTKLLQFRTRDRRAASAISAATSCKFDRAFAFADRLLLPDTMGSAGVLV